MTRRRDRTARAGAASEPGVLRAVFDNALDAIFLIDRDGRLVDANPAACALTGYTREELVGLGVADLKAPLDRARVLDSVGKLSERGRSAGENAIVRKDGSIVEVEFAAVADVVPGIHASVVRDVTERKSLERALSSRWRQQRAVAALGRAALESAGLPALLAQAVAVVIDVLQVELTSVFELLPEENRFVLRAGAGWKDEVVGRVTVEGGPGSLAGFTLDSDQPVIVEDLSTEIRFRPPRVVLDHGAVSAVAVAVRGRDRPFGVLAAHSTSSRAFAEDDVVFLRSVANILAAAVERDRTRTTLQESEERYRELVGAVSEYAASLRVEEDGSLVAEWTTEAYERILGRGVAVINAIGPLATVHPDDVAIAERALERILAGEQVTVELRQTTTTGRARWMRSFVRPVRDPAAGRVTRIFVVSQDLTDLKELEEEAVERDARLHALLEQLPVAMWTTDADLRITLSVGAGLRELGLRQNELAGTLLVEYLGTGDPEFPPLAAHLRALRGEGSSHELAWEGRDWRVHVQPLRKADGEIHGTMGVSIDVTETKRAEQKLARSLEALHAVDEERRRVMAQLVTAQHEERARISRELHDDLGQVLTSASLFAKSIEDDLAETHAGPMRALRRILDDALATTRTLAYELRPRELDLMGVLAAVERLATDLGERHGVRIEVTASGVRSDLPGAVSIAIFRIVQEALTNVFRHSGARSASVVFSGSRRKLGVLVEDDGAGFDPARGGDGLGLVDVHERAREVGGDVVVESAPGRGTVVRVEIPLPEEREP